jgi:predicted nuclease of predicted toxin-antitoxin system
VRFFLDNMVPVNVRKMLRARGHQCWTAGEAGLADEPQDDSLSVYAARRGAVLVTLDREFSQRRRKSPIGHHIWLRCLEPEAAAVLDAHLAEVLSLLHRTDVTIIVSKQGVKAASKWR